MKNKVDEVLILESDDTQTIHLYVDLPFAIQKDKSHTGSVKTMGKGAVISVFTKQKVNAHSKTEAELVAVDDVIAKILWT